MGLCMGIYRFSQWQIHDQMYPSPPAHTEVAERRGPFCKELSHSAGSGGWGKLTWGSGTKLLVAPGELSRQAL